MHFGLEIACSMFLLFSSSFCILKASIPSTMPVQQIQAFLLCGTLFLLSFCCKSSLLMASWMVKMDWFSPVSYLHLNVYDHLLNNSPLIHLLPIITMNLPLPLGKLRICPLWFPEPTIASRCMQEENVLLIYLPETAEWDESVGNRLSFTSEFWANSIRLNQEGTTG